MRNQNSTFIVGVISSSQSLNAGQIETIYHMNIQGFNFSWKVERSYREMVELFTILRSSTSDHSVSLANLPSETQQNIIVIEASIQALIDFYGENIWNYIPLLNFLDKRVEKSPMQLIIQEQMLNKLSNLEYRNNELTSIISHHESMIQTLFDNVNILQQKLSKLGNNQLNHMSVDYTSLGDSNVSDDYFSFNEKSLRTTRNSHDLSTTTESIYPKLDNNLLIGSTKDSINETETKSEMIVRTNQGPPLRSRISSSTRTEVEYSIEENEEIKTYDSELSLLVSSLTSNLQTSTMNDFNNKIWEPKSSEFLTPPRIRSMVIPTNDFVSDIDQCIDEILNLVSPSQAQLIYRGSARSFYCRLIQKQLNAKVFELGLHAIGCFLPDDPMKICIIASKFNSTSQVNSASPTASTWYMQLCNRLLQLSNNPNATYLIEESVEGLEEMIVYPTYATNHILRNSTVSNIHQSDVNGLAASPFGENITDFKINSVIDTLEVEIYLNRRFDLCFLTFFQEVSILVGKNNLFNRSVVLIRSWWVYETTAYHGSPMRHYLNDMTLVVLICAVFNRYHNIIYHPFQCLCLFLAEYSAVDWTNSIITIYGVYPIPSSYEELPYVANKDAFLNTLISENLLDKFWDLFNLSGEFSDLHVASNSPQSQNNNSELSPLTTAGAPVPASMLSSEVKEDLGITNDTVVTFTSGTDNSVDCPEQQFTREELLFEARKKAFSSFDRGLINVLHPFLHSNMITDKVSIRRLQRICKAFELASLSISTILQTYDIGLQSSGGLLKSVRSFFNGLIVRFEDGWRPDIIGNNLRYSRDTSSISVDLVNYFDVSDDVFMISDDEASQFDDIKRSTLRSIGDDDISYDKPDNFEASNDKYPRDNNHVILSRLWNEVLYAALFLEGKIAEISLLQVTKEVLADRGLLPVGEIGKTLQELTCMTSLSSKLKEKFGGLKKFLEKYSNHFIIGSDHPFNPHVYLKKLLSPTDFETIGRGSIPPQLLAKFKKATQSKKKRFPVPVVATHATTTYSSGFPTDYNNNNLWNNNRRTNKLQSGTEGIPVYSQQDLLLNSQMSNNSFKNIQSTGNSRLRNIGNDSFLQASQYEVDWSPQIQQPTIQQQVFQNSPLKSRSSNRPMYSGGFNDATDNYYPHQGIDNIDSSHHQRQNIQMSQKFSHVDF